MLGDSDVDGHGTGRRPATGSVRQIAEVADVFSLLGDPGRLGLLVALLEAGELNVGELATTCGMGESAVSHALRLLRSHRVVAVDRRGRMAYYRLADDHVRLLVELGLTHTGHASPTHTSH